MIKLVNLALLLTRIGVQLTTASIRSVKRWEELARSQEKGNRALEREREIRVARREREKENQDGRMHWAGVMAD